jgi:hypothetical protein
MGLPDRDPLLGSDPCPGRPPEPDPGIVGMLPDRLDGAPPPIGGGGGVGRDGAVGSWAAGAAGLTSGAGAFSFSSATGAGGVGFGSTGAGGGGGGEAGFVSPLVGAAGAGREAPWLRRFKSRGLRPPIPGTRPPPDIWGGMIFLGTAGAEGASAAALSGGDKGCSCVTGSAGEEVGSGGALATGS